MFWRDPLNIGALNWSGYGKRSGNNFADQGFDNALKWHYLHWEKDWITQAKAQLNDRNLSIPIKKSIHWQFPSNVDSDSNPKRCCTTRASSTPWVKEYRCGKALIVIEGTGPWQKIRERNWIHPIGATTERAIRHSKLSVNPILTCGVLRKPAELEIQQPDELAVITSPSMDP